MDTPDYGGAAWGDSTRASSRPASQKSGHSSRTARSHISSPPSEASPLLIRPEGDEHEHEHEADDYDEDATASTSLLRTASNTSSTRTHDKKPFWKKRWPSIVALAVLVLAVVSIMLGFLVTEAIEEYTMQAADFKPTKLSLDSLTDTGVRVQVEGDFTMDASRVQKESVRNIGRFSTWIASQIETGATEVDVYLPEYDMVRVGTAKIPAIKVSIRNGHTTHVSFFAHLEPGRFDNLRNIANGWMDGRLGQIRLKGKADVPLRSGLIRLGSQTIVESFTFQGDKLPSVPRYNITRLNLREQRPGHKGMGADVSIMVTNDFPVQLTIPPVAVDVLVDGCLESDQHIMVGTAETASLYVHPKTDVEVNVTGRVDTLPEALTETCPGSHKSPLDALLGDYMHGQDAKLYVSCCNFPDPETPAWAHDLLKDITVPVPLPSHEMGKLIKNFSFADVLFSLSDDPFAEPGTPEAAPKISAVVKVEINIPNQMNFPLDVNRVKADADIFYHGKLLGTLDLKKWQEANSTRIDAHGSDGPSLMVESNIQKAPINIKDHDLFSEVVQALIFGNKGVTMKVKAAVSVEVDTPMGGFAVREIPAEGIVPVKPIGSGHGEHGGPAHNISSLAPKVGNLSIIETTRTSITLQANVNITNPTNYSATVPYFNINILVNETIVGQAVAKDINVHPGNNTNLLVTAVWDPYTHSGAKGKEIGRQLLSQYISGYNVSLTLRTHNGTIPSQPALGSVLSQFPITLSAPHLSTPKDPNDEPSDPDAPSDGKTHFIRSATMHILSSTALFTLASPFSSTTMFITTLNATAFHDGHPSGKILYERPFAVPPGLSETPRLPVDWSIGSVGYDAIRKALGGTLRLSAFADVGIRIGMWREEVWYKGGSIGAAVRL